MTHAPESALPAHAGWRLLALVYDLFPVLALCFAFGAIVTGLAAALGHPDISDLPWAAPMLMGGLWVFAGGYFVLSWSRGGQTLGMRPWRLKVVGVDGRLAGRGALVRRYALATVPALLTLEALALWPGVDPSLPFWLAGTVALAGPAWSLVDGDRAALHDRWSGTRFVRLVSGA